MTWYTWTSQLLGGNLGRWDPLSAWTRVCWERGINGTDSEAPKMSPWTAPTYCHSTSPSASVCQPLGGTHFIKFPHPPRYYAGFADIQFSSICLFYSRLAVPGMNAKADVFVARHGQVGSLGLYYIAETYDDKRVYQTWGKGWAIVYDIQLQIRKIHWLASPANKTTLN